MSWMKDAHKINIDNRKVINTLKPRSLRSWLLLTPRAKNIQCCISNKQEKYNYEWFIVYENI